MINWQLQEVVNLGQQIGFQKDVVIAYNERGVSIADVNHPGGMTIDEYLGKLYELQGEKYTPLSVEEREIFACSLGSAAVERNVAYEQYADLGAV